MTDFTPKSIFKLCYCGIYFHYNDNRKLAQSRFKMDAIAHAYASSDENEEELEKVAMNAGVPVGKLEEFLS